VQSECRTDRTDNLIQRISPPTISTEEEMALSVYRDLNAVGSNAGQSGFISTRAFEIFQPHGLIDLLDDRIRCASGTMFVW